ncbi:periplasmic heavy metal sensor [Lyngbya aestuarii]|uniref:periplasmic heavy metal sensor n=1 Tax=Lyngbya aestuarii TaxID=118322 RepID=UPI00403D6954
MTLRRTILLSTVPLFLLMSGTLAVAQLNQNSQTVAQLPPPPDAPPGGERPEGPREQRWLQELDLNTEQTEQIRTIQEQSKTAAEGLRQQMQQAQEQMRSLLTSESATSDQLRQQHQELQRLHQQLADQRFEMMLSVREVLTPQQRSQMAELMSQRRGRHQGSRGK